MSELVRPDTAADLRGISRRELLRQSALATAGGLIGGSRLNAAAKGAADSKEFPKNFIWGAATAAYQVEGNNVNSDLWPLEYLPNSAFQEPAGDACDHYHLYPQDISMLADLGFNSYRFSLEWARIEPEEGHFSLAELDHYRRMLATCKEHGLKTLLTYYHFSLPRWFAYQGGWENPKAVDLFARFCEKSTRHLGDLVDFASTMNEPDIPQLIYWFNLPTPSGKSLKEAFAGFTMLIRQKLNAPEFADIFWGDPRKTHEGLLASHYKGFEAMKSSRSPYVVGFNLAMSDDQPAPTDSHLEEKRAECYVPWFEAAKKCDYLGVQMYSRSIVGEKDLPPPQGAELTQTGMEFYPECVEHVVRYAAKETGVPIMVTENGIATLDDARRVAYYQRALTGLKRAMDDGVDVRGYVAWSLLDNFEWMMGYRPKFGIVAVDRETQKRTIKPSATYLGNVARRNSL